MQRFCCYKCKRGNHCHPFHYQRDSFYPQITQVKTYFTFNPIKNLSLYTSSFLRHPNSKPPSSSALTLTSEGKKKITRQERRRKETHTQQIIGTYREIAHLVEQETEKCVQMAPSWQQKGLMFTSTVTFRSFYTRPSRGSYESV